MRFMKRSRATLVAAAVLALTPALAREATGAVTPSAPTPPAAPTTSGSPGASAGRQPLKISNASLTQRGQDLVWTVQIAQPFSPARLASQRRTLCLLIERVRDGTVSAEACVDASGRRRTPALVSEPITASGAGPATPMTATVTRSSSSELTASFLPAAVRIGYAPIRWQVISTVRAQTCGAQQAADVSCQLLFPDRPTLLSLHTPKLVGCVPSGPSERFDGSPSRREIALTFDDGPDSQPPAMGFVSLLAREHVPATFFEIGRQIPEYDPSGSIERAMLADGDMIGDHTWTHPNMTLLSESSQRSELELTVEAIRKRTGFTPCLWRPPGGFIDSELVSLARSLGMLTILWDVDPRDWALPGTVSIYQRVVTAAHNGAIVIQHFGGGPRYETLAALPHEIATLRSKGYTFVTVTQLLSLKLVYR
jgi:peptidoglycan-N-acetylglucosamine deacetylase